MENEYWNEEDVVEIEVEDEEVFWNTPKEKEEQLENNVPKNEEIKGESEQNLQNNQEFGLDRSNEKIFDTFQKEYEQVKKEGENNIRRSVTFQLTFVVPTSPPRPSNPAPPLSQLLAVKNNQFPKPPIPPKPQGLIIAPRKSSLRRPQPPPKPSPYIPGLYLFIFFLYFKIRQQEQV